MPSLERVSYFGAIGHGIGWEYPFHKVEKGGVGKGRREERNLHLFPLSSFLRHTDFRKEYLHT